MCGIAGILTDRSDLDLTRALAGMRDALRHRGPDDEGVVEFALYDGSRKQLWLVRDRLGVKPLYACRAGPATWVFASELRALLASGLVPGRLNPEALNGYLAFGCVPAPWTLVDGVESLLPAE